MTRPAEVRKVLRGGSFLLEDHRPEDIFTPEDINDELRLIGQTAAEFAEKEVLPLDAEMPEQEEAAQRMIEEAKLIGGQRVTGHVARVRPGQAGYSISEEAELIKAAAIVIGLRYRAGVPLYDKTLQTVLGERPCRVIVVSDPPASPAPIPTAALVEAAE